MLTKQNHGMNQGFDKTREIIIEQSFTALIIFLLPLKGLACQKQPWRRLVPGDGIEPSTLRSSGACSTTELPRRKN